MANLVSHTKHQTAQKGWSVSPANPVLTKFVFCVFSCFLWPNILPAKGEDSTRSKPESLAEITARLASETSAAYDACRFSALSKDYFERFSRDASAIPRDDETAIDARWRLLLPNNAEPLGRVMAMDLQ